MGGEENAGPNDHLDQLIKKFNAPRSVVAKYRFRLAADAWDDPGSILDLLGVADPHACEPLKKSASLLDAGLIPDWADDWRSFRWGIAAYNEIQDVFDAPIPKKSEHQPLLFDLWYFYYEAKNLLAESILAGLHGYYAASSAIVRTFLEFNALQLYFYRSVKTSSDYSLLADYRSKGAKPKWGSLRERILPEDPFCRPIKKKLDKHREGLSWSSSHAYEPQFSPRHHSSGPGDLSLLGSSFWLLIHQILKTVLWCYCVNFPMLFHPKQLHLKFGFSRPVGILVDEQCSKTLECALGPSDWDIFRNYSMLDEDVASLTNWYEAMPDLTEDEIWATWPQDAGMKPGTIYPEGYAQSMIVHRAFHELTALRVQGPGDQFPDGLYETFLSYEKWKKHSARKLRSRWQCARSTARASTYKEVFTLSTGAIQQSWCQFSRL